MTTNFLEKYSCKENIIIGIIVILFVNTIAFPFFPLLFSDSNIIEGKILDIRFGFTEEIVQQTLFLMTEKGRHIYYLSTLIIDIPYALIYGFVYSFLMVLLIKKQNYSFQKKKRFQTIIYFPFLISLFDLIENGGILYFITSYPQISSNVVEIISLANQLKWLTASITFILIMSLSLNVFARSIKQ